MKKNQLQPQKALNPAYKKFNPLQNNVDEFVTKLEDCIKAIQLVDDKKESEEHLKSPIRKFLSSTFYSENEINTRERIDLAVYLGKDASSDVGIIIEAKKPSNKSEFPTVNKLNSKAFQEILLYYLRERVDYKNNNIKHLIITNGFEWFFFKAEDFYALFYKNKELLKEYGRFRDGLKDTSLNELFYKEIAHKHIVAVEDSMPFVHLDFRKEKAAELKSKDLVNIYKLFSDVHLLGKSFGNDSNQLNKAFYNELLHIIGLEEVKENGKKLIQRKKDAARDYGSLLENTIFTLEDKDYLLKVKHIFNDDNKAFTVGLELCLTWVNRILFLKLLESQLLSYNGKSSAYKFLHFDFLNGFDELNELFFSALAKPMSERHPRYAEKYKNIPYLNSSLFEKNELEDLTFDITALMDEKMEVYSSSILKDSNGRKESGKLNTLDYLFRFLDAYDFSAESGVETGERQENKTLINASVLGLIFEKINGYKDGSFFTPGMITMFMCRETLRKAVIQKLKEKIDSSIETFDDAKAYCNRFYKKGDIQRLNEVINTIRICDPAVGSGHFLVSALNEMIAIKSELKILADENDAPIPCEVEIDNDELYISDAMGELFTYHRRDPNSLRIQKAIFHEKETLIENCLFGVDLNPNSVNICRLRLWIELLKNAYYTDAGELQTLPNIDINIKCGNSLVSRFALSDSLKSAFKNKEVDYSIDDYKQAVKEYKTTNSKVKKREVEGIINTVKNNFKTSYDNSQKEKVSKALGLFQNEDQRQQNLIAFGETITKTEKELLKKLKIKADQAQKQKEEILNNMIYRNAFEWRFEFPEVLDDNGNFMGFDVILGNPPYIQLQKMGAISDELQKMGYETFAKTGDIYSLFYELGNNVLKENGLLTFITSNKWMRAAYGESLRKYFNEKTNPLILIDFAGNQIFDSATVDTNILMFAKQKNELKTRACVVKEKLLNNLSVFVRQNAVIAKFENSDSWVILSNIEKQIKEKIERIGTPLKDWDITINYGIKTGYNDAFIISGERRKELIGQDPKSVEIIRPILRGRDIKKFGFDFADLWLINTHNGLKEKGIKPINVNDYPAIKKHLDSYFPGLQKRGDKGDTPYNLRNCAYMDDLNSQKIIWGEISDKTKFSIDLDGTYANEATTFLMTGKSLIYLLGYLNSKLSEYLFSKLGTTTGVGTVRWKKFTIEQLLVPKLDLEEQLSLENVALEIIKAAKHTRETGLLEKKFDNILYKCLEFTDEEISFIELQ
ncbi:Eco57I restriction-modification methylase domain-containing protein [Chryseobacterium sp.]|uniref:type IIG restriction enzyme/methyltransferase n=1 Tax=Chryseobacterium sp. TaxID=1871047 RepID=UPI0011CB0577|nr:Eco57I restriction-modification methylase domain-containing protein [Chryseobacterium sp.]TXF77784.1 class I SAM-dependent DNA methyltransferase [Chryseobacterium sp.]